MLFAYKYKIPKSRTPATGKCKLFNNLWTSYFKFFLCKEYHLYLFHWSLSIFRTAFEREAAEGSDAIDPPQRPQSSANNHQTGYKNLNSLNNSRSSVSPSGSKVSRSSDNTPVPIHTSKPVPLDQLLSQTDSDYNGNLNKETFWSLV